MSYFKSLGATDAQLASCTDPNQVWNDTAGRCVSLDQNLALINADVAKASRGGVSPSWVGSIPSWVPYALVGVFGIVMLSRRKGR